MQPRYKISSPLQQDASPARPARSRMRDNPGASPPSPARPTRTLRPIQTQLQQTDDHLSPTSPESPFSDPFAQDRSQRAKAQAVAKQSSNFTPAGQDRLRNAVGAFMTAGRKEEPRRPGRLERHRPEHPDAWDISGEGKFAAVDNVLLTIKQDWPFVLESDFAPSTLALSLLSKSSDHPSLSSFLRLHDALSASLQSAVQSHFQSFAASLPAHAQFVTTLATAQNQVRSSKESLKLARDGFAGKGKSELAGVRARERTVREMLQILDTM
jgi:exocyst complex component 4